MTGLHATCTLAIHPDNKNLPSHWGIQTSNPGYPPKDLVRFFFPFLYCLALMQVSLIKEYTKTKACLSLLRLCIPFPSVSPCADLFFAQFI